MENKGYVILLWDFDLELSFFVLLIAYYLCSGLYCRLRNLVVYELDWICSRSGTGVKQKSLKVRPAGSWLVDENTDVSAEYGNK